MRKRLLIMLSFFFILSMILVGCFQGEQDLEKMDDPEDAERQDATNDQEREEDASNDDRSTNESESDDNDSEGDEELERAETVARELYLLDVNGMVVQQTLELPNPESKEVATQVLEYLVKDGPVTPMLPNGFQAVLPAGTEVLSLNLLEDGTLIVDLSEEFTEYRAEDEIKILEAMTFTLTQFDTVDRIKLRINGHSLDQMPVNGTPIREGYSRNNGINYVESNVLDLMESQSVTLYYPSEYNGTRYYVPITTHVQPDHENDLYHATIETLINGPGYGVNVIHVFNDHTELMNEATLNDGVLELVFNERILQDVDQAIISDEVIETIVRSLTTFEDIESVSIQVDNVEVISNENGEIYDEPISIDQEMIKQKL